MSDSIINTEELIEIPSYLSDANYGISLAASDCGVCQSNIQGCGSSEYGSCSVCEDGFEGGTCSSSEDCSSCQSSCQHTCEDSCQLDCEGSSQCSCQTTSACQSVSSCMNYCQTDAMDCGSCESGCQSCQTGCEVASQRPENWVWVTNVATGAPILFTADEWNGFTDRINEFRTYKRLSNITFTKATKGQFIMANHIVEGWNAINDMSPPSALPEKVAPGSTITAISLNGLVSSLNSIQ